MNRFGVLAPLRHKLGEIASDGLMEMFADAHKLATESFERRLIEELGKIRLEIADLRADLLKWSFVFWIGQLAAVAGVLSILLRSRG
jgi:hypothetical protein